MRLDDEREPGDEPEATSWRQRRIMHLARLVAAGRYDVPPVEVAHAILYGRPRWGDNPKIMVAGGERLTVEAGTH